MNTITEHIPDFIDTEGYKHKKVNFNSLEELIQIDFVKEFSERKGFAGLALSGNYLIAVYRKGRSWRVVGMIENANALDLPSYYPGEKFTT